MIYLLMGQLIWVSNSGHLYEQHFDIVKNIVETYHRHEHEKNS